MADQERAAERSTRFRLFRTRSPYRIRQNQRQRHRKQHKGEGDNPAQDRITPPGSTNHRPGGQGIRKVDETAGRNLPAAEKQDTLVVKGPPQRVAVVQLSRNKNGGYWSVTTVYPPKNQKFTGTALWRGRQPSQSSSNSTQPLQTIDDGHGIEMAISSSHPSSTSGQSASGETNISKPKNEINKAQRSILTLRCLGHAMSYIKTPTQRDIRKSIHHPPLLIKPRQLHGSKDFNGLQVSIETGRSQDRWWRRPALSSQFLRIVGTGDHLERYAMVGNLAGNIF